MPPRRHPRSWLAGRLRSAAGAVQRLAGRVEPTGHLPQRVPSDAPTGTPRRFGEPPRHWLDLVAAHAPGLLRDLDLDASPTDAGQTRGRDDQQDGPAAAAVAPAPPDGPIRWADGTTRWDTADRPGTPAGEGTGRSAGTDGFRAGGTGGGFGDTAGTGRTDAVNQPDARGGRGLWSSGTPGTFGIPGGTATSDGVEPVGSTGRAGIHATVGDPGTAGGHGTAGQQGTDGAATGVGGTATGVGGMATGVGGMASGVGGPRTVDGAGRSGGSRSAGGTGRSGGATDGLARGSAIRGGGGAVGGGSVGGGSDATVTSGGPGGGTAFAPSDRRMPGRMRDGWRLASPFSRGPSTGSARPFGPAPRHDTPAVGGDGLPRAINRPLAPGEFLHGLDPSGPNSTTATDGAGRGGLAAVEAAGNGPWPALPGERTWPEQHVGPHPGQHTGQHRDHRAGHPGGWRDGDVGTVGAGIGGSTRDPGSGGWPVSRAFRSPEPTALTTDPWPALPDDGTLWTVPGDALDATQLGRLDREQAGD
ncbi:hypothetical protein ACQP08_17815 [Micromonospora zamorensis]|uniref:hypothetical protein n=1 Tax=Micromonospora zamorensis TaxID=709883 RepID=UPI003D93C2C4